MEQKKEKKEKKEAKFNGARIARQAEKSLKAVFPKAKFFVASDARPVDIVSLDMNGYTPAELNMFRHIFCTMTKLNTADLTISLAKRETPAPATAPAK
jgi:malate/lactate dehydrogenase